MFIEEITIDGFKSYAQRVTVGKFDQHFNAITGLNGSGKSNILDAICFVLGITNLSQVRANSLQELVYKGGQAGVTKASVSITFNNEDKQSSPVGCEELDKITVTRQIAVGGRNKYLINGKVAQPERVKTLFHSVQLNVNNPHFLIMQGRITKVLNMKPPEILSMLEEAAGTRMYEAKKEAALKTLDKKQVKVDEIDEVLREEIIPSLEKLREERSAFLQHSDRTNARDALARLLQAWRWARDMEFIRSGGNVARIKAELERLGSEKAEEERELKQREVEMDAALKEKERREGEELDGLKRAADAAGKEHAKKASAEAAVKESLQAESKTLDGLRAQLAALEAGALAAAREAAMGADAAARQVVDAAQRALDAAKLELAGAQAGDGRDESNRTLQERLADARNGQTSARAEGQKAANAVKMTEQALREARKVLAMAEREGDDLSQRLGAAAAAMDEARAALGRSGYDEAVAAQATADKEREEKEAEAWRDRCRALAPAAQGAAFDYYMPRAPLGFRPEGVLGTLAQLIRVKDPETYLALEVAAGRKLKEVVVDTEETAKALLKFGRLRSRTTFIPLSRIKAVSVSSDKIERARQLVGDRAALAADLVDYDPTIERAVRYALGSVFICKDDRAAKQLAYSRDVAVRCVTLRGDDFSPSGVLSGGSRDKGTLVLKAASELQEARRRLAAHEAAVGRLTAQMAAQEDARARHGKLVEAVELAVHEYELLQGQVEVSRAHQARVRVEELEKDLESSKTAVAEAERREREAEAEAARLEHEAVNWETVRVERMREAEAKIARAKEQLVEARRRKEEAEEALQRAEAEEEAATEERGAVEERVAAAERAVQQMRNELEKLGAAERTAAEAKEKVEAALEEARKQLKECDADLAKLSRRKQAIEAKLSKMEETRKDLDQELGGAEEELESKKKRVQLLEEQEDWIKLEKGYFGVEGSAYDFAKAEREEGGYEKLVARLEKMSDELRKAKVNPKAMTMYEKVEADYGHLAEKKRIVECDRDKIQRVITELDEKKRAALEATWRKVGKDFGSIFSTLLPGTSAKLEPPEDAGSFMDGLEVRVAFGGVWKQSLTELSGGQRSLLALSLILALLLFKPAPIYILDEVDAALDLSHTQNIGHMIKTHFPYSQFVVVSLKEGMFNNANVLFRTKFVEGNSTVMRTAPNRNVDTNGSQSKGGHMQRAPLAENAR